MFPRKYHCSWQAVKKHPRPSALKLSLSFLSTDQWSVILQLRCGEDYERNSWEKESPVASILTVHTGVLYKIHESISGMRHELWLLVLEN